MNVADSDEMFAHLAARGAVLTDKLDEADTVLINTCTVREHAEHRAVSFLGRLAKWKQQKPGRWPGFSLASCFSWRAAMRASCRAEQAPPSTSGVRLPANSVSLRALGCLPSVLS